VEVRRGAGVMATVRRVGRELSRRLHTLLTSNDAQLILRWCRSSTHSSMMSQLRQTSFLCFRCRKCIVTFRFLTEDILVTVFVYFLFFTQITWCFCQSGKHWRHSTKFII